MLTERRAHCSLDSQIGVGDGGEVRLVVHSKVEGAEAGASDRVSLVGDTEVRVRGRMRDRSRVHNLPAQSGRTSFSFPVATSKTNPRREVVAVTNGLFSMRFND